MKQEDIWHRRRESAAVKELVAGLNGFIADKFLSDSVLRTCDDMIVAHRKAWKAKSLDFPELVPVALPSLHVYKLYRRDLDDKYIQMAIANVVVESFPHQVGASELTRAVKRAWPHYRPSMILSVRDMPNVQRLHHVETIN